MSEFTETQERMLAVLRDGMAHHRNELRECCPDNMTSDSCIRAHLSNIRKVLRRRGEDIVCVWQDRCLKYRHVRLLASAVDGVT